MFWIKCLIFLLGLRSVTTQACDSASDVTQCEDGEICRNNVCENASCISASDTTQCSPGEICRNNVCEDALYCGDDDNNPCTTIIRLFCVSDYCQPSPCTSTGQCVHGHVCSQDTARACVYPVVSTVEEGSEFTLRFREPATFGTYEYIQWYKGSRSSLSRVAVIHPVITDNKPLYYNDLCSGNSVCRTSNRAHLNTSTGELTIFNVKFGDEGFYYYQFYNYDDIPNTGNKYEYKLNVYDCNSSSDVTQCEDEEICRNDRCENALYCDGDSNLCLSTRGLLCVTNYCQPSPCHYTGQCVHGQVCSQNTNRRCVYPSVSNVEEGSEFTLAFKEPATPGSYEEIQWYKGGRRSLDRVAIIHPVITDSRTRYYNNFCSGNSPCHTSDRANLNIDTGELTIFNVTSAYEGFYYYKFLNLDNTPETGMKYEYKVNVYVIPTKLTIEGVPSEYIEVGTNPRLTCTVDRIRPLALAMFWVVHGRNESGALSNTGPDVNGAYTQTTTYIHVVTREDKSVPIRCVVVPIYGELVEVEAVIKPGYAPFGTPRVEFSRKDHFEGEKVTLTCTNPKDDGNPPCNTYVWRRLEGNINFTRETQIHTFIMDEFHAGNYTCQCSNQFGDSEVSDEVEIVFLGERPEMSFKDNRWLIAGCVIGVLVLVGLVVVAVFVCTKYQFNLQIKSRRATAADQVDQEMHGYENPVDNNVNPIPAGPPANEYQYIGAGAMARPRDEGYVNPAVTTYEDVL